MTYHDPHDLAAAAQKIASDVRELNANPFAPTMGIDSLCTAIELLATAIGSIAADRQAPTT